MISLELYVKRNKLEQFNEVFTFKSSDVKVLFIMFSTPHVNSSIYSSSSIHFWSISLCILSIIISWSYIFYPCKIVFLHLPIVRYQNLLQVYLEICYFHFSIWYFSSSTCGCFVLCFDILLNVYLTFFWCHQWSLILHLFPMSFAESSCRDN